MCTRSLSHSFLLHSQTHLDAADSRHTVQKGTADKSSSVNEAASVIVGLVKLEHRLKEVSSGGCRPHGIGTRRWEHTHECIQPRC